MPDFVPGLELARRFYAEAVAPMLAREFPGLRYSAALIGSGSEVLGFDTVMSTDHHWGPRAMLFLAEEDHARHAEVIRATLGQRLPPRFLGYSTHFSPPNPEDNGTQLLVEATGETINHRVEILTLRGYLRERLGFDIARPIEPADWLTFPQQRLLELTSGVVFYDDLGLGALRERCNWYPHDVWLYLLAAGWARIGQEEHLMGRAGLAGDEIGSILIGGRLVRDLMRLCFLMERRYAPYAKWFGTAFARLACGPALAPTLGRALQAATWQERQEHLAAAYGLVANLHNQLRLTEPLPADASPFFGRPFMVIWGDRFADALRRRITDPAVAALAARPLIGGIDLISDNTDLLENPMFREALRTLYTQQ